VIQHKKSLEAKRFFYQRATCGRNFTERSGKEALRRKKSPPKMTRMVQTAPSREAVDTVSSEREIYLRAFRGMLLARTLDDKFAALYRAGKIHGGVFLGRGQEALSVAAGLSLRKGDIFAPLIRDQAGRLAFGETVLDAVRTYIGSPLGPMRGRDGNVHRGVPRDGLLPMISHLGAMISVVNGALLARRFQNRTGHVGLACIGDGATSTGSVHEALNQAAVEKLPLILIVANNQFAYSTPTQSQFACKSLADRAVGYGVRGHEVDGTDLAACLKVVGDAVSLARNGGGPQLIVAHLLRLCGHGEHDDASYIDTTVKKSVLGRDCLALAGEHLLKHGWADAETIATWRSAAVHQVEEAVALVQHEPAPDPFAEKWHALATDHLLDTNEASADAGAGI
jgi:pyruvate dehydrogenase E1 component alpha subunit/2-oxoisovalerate dehydrogenase E1 component alpha subunit